MMFAGETETGLTTSVKAAIAVLSNGIADPAEIRKAFSTVGRHFADNIAPATSPTHVIGTAADFDEFAVPLIETLAASNHKVTYQCVWPRLVESDIPGRFECFLEKEYRQKPTPECESLFVVSAIGTEASILDMMIERGTELMSPRKITIITAIASHDLGNKAVPSMEIEVSYLLREPKMGKDYYRNTLGVVSDGLSREMKPEYVPSIIKRKIAQRISEKPVRALKF